MFFSFIRNEPIDVFKKDAAALWIEIVPSYPPVNVN